MPFRLKVSIVILCSLLGLLLIGPLIIPIPPLADTVPVRQLADPDSAFIRIGDVELHYKTAGDPASPRAFVLLHGFGSSTYTWHAVMDALAAYGFVVAFDRPPFGLSARPLPGEWQGQNPYTPEGQLELTLGLMDALGIDQAVLVGNSAGGTVALALALEHPDRVSALVLVSAAVYQVGGPPAWSRWLLYTPQLNRLGPLFMRQLAGTPGETFLEAAWSDPERIDEATRTAYRKPLRAQNWDRALWEFVKASRDPQLAGRLSEVTVPTLILYGADDQIVPPALNERLANELPQAQIASLPGCGHVPQEECPDAFLAQLASWLETLPPATQRP